MDFLNDLDEEVFNAVCEAEGTFMDIMVSKLEAMIGKEDTVQGEEQ